MCLLFHNQPGVWADAHHPSPGRKRIHDKVAFALCPWHHRGVTILKNAQAKEVYGPSMALEKRAFVEAYGTELELYEKQLQLWDEYVKHKSS